MLTEIQILRRQFKATTGYDPTDWRAAESFADIVHGIESLGEDPWIDDEDDDPSSDAPDDEDDEDDDEETFH